MNENRLGKKLTIFLIDGNEFGPRSIEIGNWSGKAIYSPRTTLPKIFGRSEFESPGVYFLKSTPESDTFSERVYIGETEKIGERLKQHLRDGAKEFTEFIAFMSKDEMLTKSHIKFLESRLISLAKEAKTAEIENNTAPSLPTLPEADISDMEYFLEQIKLILPLMGFMFLVPTVVNKPKEEMTDKPTPPFTEKIYSLKSNSYKATMYESERGFIVSAGSQCNKKLSKSISQGWVKLRQKLLESGALIDKGEFFEFAEDTVFSSASAASSLVLGRQSAGPVEWIDAGGKTFKEVQEEQFGNTE